MNGKRRKEIRNGSDSQEGVGSVRSMFEGDMRAAQGRERLAAFSLVMVCFQIATLLLSDGLADPRVGLSLAFSVALVIALVASLAAASRESAARRRAFLGMMGLRDVDRK